MPHVLRITTARSVQGWTLSLLAHGLIISTAITLLRNAPQPVLHEPFTWNVKLVGPPPAPAPPAAIPSPSPSPQTTTAQPSSTTARPTETTSVVRTVQQTQPIHQAVRQTLTVPKPTMQEVVPATRMTPQRITETQPAQPLPERLQQEVSAAKPLVQEAGPIRQSFQQTQQTVIQTSSFDGTSRDEIAVEARSTPAATPEFEAAVSSTAGLVTRTPVSTEGPESTIHREPTQSHSSIVTHASPSGTAAVVSREPSQSIARHPIASPSPTVNEIAPHAVERQRMPPSVRATEPSSEINEEDRLLAAASVHAPALELPLRGTPGTKVSYGWLAQELWDRVERLKRYPRLARLNGWEGKVVIRAVIDEQGRLVHQAIEESSGYEALDEHALELMKQVCPVALRHPLGQPQVAVHVPIHYRIEQ